MTSNELERLQLWMSNPGAFTWAGTQAIGGIVGELLAELRDHEQWKARFAQDSEAYTQGKLDRTAEIRTGLQAMRDHQRSILATCAMESRRADYVRAGVAFLETILDMMDKQVL